MPAKLKRFKRFSLPVVDSDDDDVNLLLTFLRLRLVTAESEQVEVFKAFVSLPGIVNGVDGEYIVSE